MMGGKADVQSGDVQWSPPKVDVAHLKLDVLMTVAEIRNAAPSKADAEFQGDRECTQSTNGEFIASNVRLSG